MVWNIPEPSAVFLAFVRLLLLQDASAIVCGYR